MVDKIQQAITSSNNAAVRQIRNAQQPQRQNSTPPANVPAFDELLKQQLAQPSSVRLSAHAQKRIQARNIPFGAEEAARLDRAVEKAANKGSRESLILMDDLALVVSVKNRVVITAVDAKNRKEDVFTNIDSVVLS